MFTKKISEKISYLIGLVGLLLFPVVINATNFTDNHNDNTLTGWTTNGSRTWTEASGVAAPANGNANVGYLINNTTPSANGTLEVRMTADQWNGYKGGVVFRWSSTTSYYFVTVLPGNQYSSYIAFCKNSMDAATGTKVAQNFTMGTTFTLKIEMIAGTFKFYIDGTLRGQVTDNTLASGKIGYAHTNDWNRYTTYDNITWTDAAATNYTLTATTVGTGTVSPATGTYPSGTSVAVTATAGAGWHFANWSGDATGTTNPLTVVMSANRAIVANFVQDTYTFSATTVGSGTVTPASGTYTAGTSVSVTATAAVGWRFSNWSGDVTGSTNPVTVVMSANRAIVANFVQNTYTFTATTVGSGTVTPASGTYTAGTSVAVTATAAAGWHFDHWSGDATGSTNPLTVVMSANRAIVATFVQNTYTFTATTVGSGTVTPASGTYTSGTSVAVTATAAAGWHFDHWSGDATGSTNPLTVVMSANLAVVATFVQNTYTFTATTVGSGTVTPTSGTYTSGTSVAVTATEAAGWHFDHWSGDATGSTNPLTVVMSANRAIVANFAQNSYTLTITTSGSGSVTPPSGTTYLSGTSVSVTATAASGWHFDHWSGGVTGTTNPVSVEMISDLSIQAVFSENATQYTLTSTVTGTGTITPASGPFPAGSSVTVTATPGAGWHFDHWSGDATGTTNPVTVVMSANRSIVANFVQNAYELSATTVGNGTVAPASGTYLSGTSVVVTATPAAGWRFDHWSGDVSGTTNPVTVVMSVNRVFVAHFVQLSYTLSATVTGGGTVSPASGTYLSGTSVVITATPAAGWHFDSWSGDVSGTTNPVTVTMSANRNINAIFTENAPVTPNSQKLSISSRLLNADGTPVGNDVAEERDITIRLYDQEVGGNLLFTETYLDANGQAAIVNRGYFVVRLGEGTTTGNLAAVLTVNSNIWVEITVGTATFPQRMPLTSAPYVIH